MFRGAESFNQPLNFTTTRKVVNMLRMFNGARSFNQPLNFNTENVIDMAYMFANCPISEENKCSSLS
jgi:surface protein